MSLFCVCKDLLYGGTLFHQEDVQILHVTAVMRVFTSEEFQPVANSPCSTSLGVSSPFGMTLFNF